MINENIEYFIGELCKRILPIKHEYYTGKGSKIAICTLSSIKLLIEISNDSGLMNNVAIVGRLLSENKGIDKIIRFCLSNKDLEHLVICGKDTHGHKAGDALLALHKYGITNEGMIMKSKSPDPHIMSSYDEVELFRNNITIHNLIEQTDLNVIRKCVDRFA